MNRCKWNDAFDVKLTPKMRKYFADNPICKSSPVYQGYCSKHMPLKLKRKRAYEATTIEQRQQYLDLLREGKTIGEAYKTVGISFDAAIAITNKAIKMSHYMTFMAE